MIAKVSFITQMSQNIIKTWKTEYKILEAAHGSLETVFKSIEHDKLDDLIPGMTSPIFVKENLQYTIIEDKSCLVDLSDNEERFEDEPQDVDRKDDINDGHD